MTILVDNFSSPFERRHRPHGVSLGSVVGSAGLRALAAIARLMSRLAESRRKRRAYLDLIALDDHVLKDIGITRGEIHLRVYRR